MICKSTLVHGEEAVEEATDHPGEMGEFRSLRCMNTDQSEYLYLLKHYFCAYCLSIALHAIVLKTSRVSIQHFQLGFPHL